MATVTVNQNSSYGVTNMTFGAYGVQRLFRNGMSSGEIAAAKALVADLADTLVIHWSGGYHNANSGEYQSWNQGDFAPTSMGSARAWSGTSRKSFDQWITELNDLRNINPNIKIVFVMHDFPEAMLGGDTRSSTTDINPWPDDSLWGAGFAFDLCEEVIDRVGEEKILAFSYGQELKGFTSRTNTTELANYIAGFEAWATLMAANYPDIERWYPHYNFFAMGGVLTTRRDAINSLVGGGSALQTDDDTAWGYLIDNVDHTLIDRVTYDNSIVDNSGSDTWRGDYASILARYNLDENVQRVCREYMADAWGAGNVKPLVSIESYYDVRTGDHEDYTDDEHFALGAATVISRMRGGCTKDCHWEPQGGNPGSETPNGHMNAAWFNNDGVDEWDNHKFRKDLITAFPPGTALVTTTSDDSNVIVISSVDKICILNGNTSSEDVDVVATGGSLETESIPAYSYSILDLPAIGGGSPSGPADVVVTNLGETQGEANALTATFQVSNTVPVGAHIFAWSALNAITEPSEVDSVTDESGNTYSVVKHFTNGSNVTVSILVAEVTTQLDAGDDITFNWGNGSTQLSRWAVSAFAVEGLAKPLSLDQNPTVTTGGGTSLSVTTGATTVDDEVVFGFFAFAGAGLADGFTAADPYIEINTIGSGAASSGRNAAAQYKVVSTTGTQTVNGTISSSNTWGAAALTYEIELLQEEGQEYFVGMIPI